MYYCDICNYNTPLKRDFARHMESNRHKIKTDNVIGYECNICNYNTVRKYLYTKHMESNKHLEKVIESEKNISPTMCNYCNKEYHNKKSLWKHKQICHGQLYNARNTNKPVDEQNDKSRDKPHYEPEDEYISESQDEPENKFISKPIDDESVDDSVDDDESIDDSDDDDESIDDSDDDEDEKNNTPNVLMEVIANLRKEMDELKKSKVVDESQKRDDVIVEILKTNKELQNCMLQTVTEVKTIVQNSGTNNNTNMNNNSHNSHNTNTNTLNQNKTFNMNFFLNEHCKNAIDIGDFIKNLDYSKENMIENRSMNYYERISNQFKEGFENCKVENRPIHCSDSKRNKMYIKDNGEWISGKDSEKRIKQIVVGMGIANMDTFRNWVTDNPACLSLDTPAFKMYMCILRNILGPTSDKEEEKFVNKVINTIVDETVIDKEKYAVC